MTDQGAILALMQQLHYGLAMVLTFIGIKMLLMPWYHMPVGISLAIVPVLIGLSVIASLIATRQGTR